MAFMNKSNVKMYADVNEQRSKLFPFAYLNDALTLFAESSLWKQWNVNLFMERKYKQE